MNRPSSRPYDPTARSSLNLIIGEERLLATGEDYIFIPSHGPFFTENVVVRSRGLLLQKGKDYELKALHMDATNATGKEVACVIQITNKNLFEVTIDYQVVGGQFAEVYSVLKYLIDNMGNPITDIIPWESISNKPELYNSAAHRHPYWDIDGWEGLYTPLNKILQGVYHRKMVRMRKTYDYYYSKELAFVTNRDTKIAAILKSIELMQLTNVDPLRVIRIVTDTIPPNVETHGVWQTVTAVGQDRVLGGAGSADNNGTTINISKDIVYPQPDNIILDEEENPILRDDDEWIYQDNQYPTIPLAGDLTGEDGIEFTAQEWDLFYYKAYFKVGHAGALFATITANKAQIVDGETVTFKLTTSRYPVGLRVPYRLLGVSPANVNVPLTGFVIIGSDGTVNLPVTLISQSPATFKDELTLELAISGGITNTIKYTLSTNDNKLVKLDFTQSLNDLEKAVVLPYEQFYLMVDRSGFLDADSKFVDLNFTFDDGVKHPIVLDYNRNVVPGTPVNVELDNAKDWFSIKIEPLVAFASRTLNLNLTYKGRVIASTAINTADVSGTVYAISLETGLPITEIIDDKPFRFVAETNTTGVLLPVVIVNTVGDELTPAITLSTTIENGLAQTPTLTVSRKNRKREDFVAVKFSTLYGKVLGSYQIKIPINV